MNAQARTAQATVKVLTESPAMTMVPLLTLSDAVHGHIARDGMLFTMEGYPATSFIQTVAVARRDFLAAN